MRIRGHRQPTTFRQSPGSAQLRNQPCTPLGEWPPYRGSTQGAGEEPWEALCSRVCRPVVCRGAYTRELRTAERGLAEESYHRWASTSRAGFKVQAWSFASTIN